MPPDDDDDVYLEIKKYGKGFMNNHVYMSYINYKLSENGIGYEHKN
jgi:hypothetical protein